MTRLSIDLSKYTYRKIIVKSIETHRVNTSFVTAPIYDRKNATGYQLGFLVCNN